MGNLTQDRVFSVLWPEGFHIVSRQQTSHVFLGLRPKFLRPAYPRGETSVMLPSRVIALMEKFNLTVPALRFYESVLVLIVFNILWCSVYGITLAPRMCFLVSVRSQLPLCRLLHRLMDII
jgi:hypothetical protein